MGGGARGHTSAAVGDIKFHSAGFIHSPGRGEREGEKKEGKEEAAGGKEEIQAPQGQTSHTGTLNTACASWCDCRVCILYMCACVCVCICLFQQEIRAQPGKRAGGGKDLSNLLEQVCEAVALSPPLPPLPQSLPAVQAFYFPPLLFLTLQSPGSTLTRKSLRPPSSIPAFFLVGFSVCAIRWESESLSECLEVQGEG